MTIKINTNLELLSESDDGFIVDDRLVRGGYKVVASTAERDAIPMSARKLGMIVYENVNKVEYQLVGGLTNSSWQVKVISGLSLPDYAKISGTVFTGVVANSLPEIKLINPITRIEESFSLDTDIDKLHIQLSAEDLKYVGETSILKGTNSGATAIVLGLVSGGVIIPSKTAPVSVPVFRNGTFIQGEQLALMAGPSIARNSDALVTRKAVEDLTITKLGGACYGEISVRPIYRHTTTSTVTSINDFNALGLSELRMSFTTTDRMNVHNNMSLKTPRGDLITGIRLSADQKGIIIASSEKTKVQIGDTFKIMNPVIAPVEQSHLSSKQYVDDKTDRVELTINSSYFTSNGVVTDPLTNASKRMSSFTIPNAVYSGRWPLVELYAIVNKSTYTDYVKVSSSVYRHVVRKTATGIDIIIEVWDADPTTIQVIIH